MLPICVEVSVPVIVVAETDDIWPEVMLPVIDEAETLLI